MPIISEQMKKATKKAEAHDKKKKEEEEHRLREEEARKEQEERETKEREEQEKLQKRSEKKQKIKDRRDKAKKEKADLERKTNIRKEMAMIRKSLGAKPLKDEDMLERQGFQVLRKEVASTSHSKIYRAKQGENENIVCKVIILDKIPQNVRQTLLETSLKVQRYIGGASGAEGGEPKHPGFLKVLDVFATDKKAYIFLEECQGMTLKEKIKKGETSDENEVKKTIRELAQGVEYLHNIGVSHTNLRPKSVLYNKENQLKVVGLNHCSFYWDSDMETVVMQKRLSKKDFEKNSHLPPEAFRADTFDPSLADVWGLGVILCQMVAKENPFKIKSEQPFLDQWRTFAESKQFSDEAKQLLDRIFTDDPQTRPNITEVLDDPYLKNVS